MKVPSAAYSLAFLAAFAGAGRAQADPKPEVKEAISALLSEQMWLHIYSDGSGTIGYGAGGSNQASFKAGTFDVAQVTKDLKALAADEKGARETHYAYWFEAERRGAEDPKLMRFTRDEKVIPNLFDKAARESGLLKDYPQLEGELRKTKK